MKLHTKRLQGVLEILQNPVGLGDSFLRGYLLALVGQGLISMSDMKIFFPNIPKPESQGD